MQSIRKIIRILFVLLTTLENCINVHSQENDINFRNLNVENGLSHSNVRTICQDSLGFLWIGTDNGLNRYDGKNFVVYKHNFNSPNSLLSSQIYCVYEDSKGNLWIGTSLGLNLYDRKNNSYIHNTEWTDKPVNTIFEDLDQVLWIGAAFCLMTINLKDNLTHVYKLSDYIDSLPNNNYALCFFQDHQKNLWIGSTTGINVLKYGTNKFFKYTKDPNDPNSLMDKYIFTIWEDKLNRIWVGNKQGIDIIINSKDIPAKLECLHINKDNDPNFDYGFIQNIFEDSKHNLYITPINGGLYIIKDVNNIENIKLPLTYSVYQYNPNKQFGLSSNSVNNIYEDMNNNIWLGCSNGGLNYSNKLFSKFQYYSNEKNAEQCIINNKVNVFLDEKDFLWIGTEGGLSWYDKTTKKFKHFKHDENNATSIGSNAIWAIYRDKQKKLWIGGWDCGLNLFNEKSEQFINYRNNPTNPYSISNNNVFSIFEDSHNNLWVLTVGGYLHLFDRNKKQFSIPIKKKAYYEDIKETSDGKLWLANSDALECFDPIKKEITKYQRIPNDKACLSSNIIFTIFVDSKKNLWVGTDNGLNLFQPTSRQFKYYQVQDGLPDNSIKGIVEDNNGNLWISTNNSISEFKNAIHLPIKPAFKNYSKEDGLQSNEFIKRSCAKDIDGKVFFGGNNGYNVIDPNNIVENIIPPRIVFTELSVLYQAIILGSEGCPITEDITIAKEIHLQYWQSAFSIKFAALNFICPEKNQYAYKMEGFDNDWNLSGNKSEATYTNLEPGKYIFRVKASNNDGYWNESGNSIDIYINPPWWKTWWAKAVLYSLIIVLIGLFISYRLRFYRIQNVNLSKKVKETTTEISEKNRILEQQKNEIEDQNSTLLLQKEEIASQNVKLIELNAAKDKFFGIIAHDLRNPFGSITGLLDLIVNERESFNEAEMMLNIELVNKSAHSVSKLLDNLLEWAHTQTGNIGFEPVYVKIVSLVQEVLNLLETNAKSKQIDINYHVQEGLSAVADLNMLKTILSNLITNAIKFTPRNGNITVTAIQNNNEIAFSVKDTGIGMSENVMKNLFKISEKTTRLGTERESGTGLGLILCKEFIERHKGRIWFESQEGKGTTLTFTIPVILD